MPSRARRRLRPGRIAASPPLPRPRPLGRQDLPTGRSAGCAGAGRPCRSGANGRSLWTSTLSDRCLSSGSRICRWSRRP